MQKFCTKCGNKLDEQTGKCPVCGVELTKKELRKQKKEQKKEAKKAAKKEKWKKLPFKQKVKKICLRFLAIILVLLLITSGITGTLVYFKVIDIPVVNGIFEFFGINKNNIEEKNTETEENITQQEDGDVTGQYSVEHPDANEYYKNNSNILSETKVLESDVVFSESEVHIFFAERGFSQCPITTTYSLEGDYFEAMEVSAASSSKHPMYETTYITKNGDVWSITIVNDTITAFPVDYNLQYNQDVQVILSETEYVTSYDSVTNKFYKTIPNNDILSLKTITRIDADTLENLNFGEIDKL